MRHGPGFAYPGRDFGNDYAAAIGACPLEGKPNVDAAVPAAGAIVIPGGCEKSVVAARCGVGMSVPVLLNLIIVVPAFVIISVIVPMIVRLHDLMFVRFAVVGPILRAEQRRGQPGHRKSRQSEQCGFQKMLAHGLSLFGLKQPCWGCPNRAAIPGGSQPVSV